MDEKNTGQWHIVNSDYSRHGSCLRGGAATRFFGRGKDNKPPQAEA